jgi:hypothetical protein
MPTISESDISEGRDAIHAIEGAYAAFEREYRQARASGKLTALCPALGTLAITTALNHSTVGHVAGRLNIDVAPMLAWNVVVSVAHRVSFNDPAFSELARFQPVAQGWPAAYAALKQLLYAIGASAAGFAAPSPAENGVRPDPVAVATKANRRGRLSRDESEIRHTAMLAELRQHPTLKDFPARLAKIVGVGVSTIRRWLEEDDAKYRDTHANQTADDPGEQ